MAESIHEVQSRIADAKIRSRLTKQGWLFVVGIFLLYGASLTSQSSLLLLLDGIFCGCYWVNWRLSRRVVSHVRLLPPPYESIPEHGKTNQSWHLQNLLEMKVGPIWITRENDTKVMGVVPLLNPNEKASFVRDHARFRRGVYPHSTLRIRCAYPFGLIESESSQGVEGELVVYPALYSAPCPPAAGFEPMVGGKFKGRRRSVAGGEFAGVRPFVSGDPLRQIHWKSSSKGQGLMVKTFEEELSGRVGILLEFGKGVTTERLDDAIRAAGSMLFSALDEGHHVEFLSIFQPEDFKVLPPFTDGEQILDMFARIQIPERVSSETTMRLAVQKFSSRSALCIVSTDPTQELVNTINESASMHRRLSLVIPQGLDGSILKRLSSAVRVFQYDNRSVSLI